MLAPISRLTRSVDQYRQWVGDGFIDDIGKLAAPLKGSRVLHLCNTASRCWTQWTLSSLVSLMRDLGIASEGYGILTNPEQMRANQAINRALDGHYVQLTPGLCNTWLQNKDIIVDISLEDYDFIVVHDTEIAGVAKHVSKQGVGSKTRWIWHCHSDLYSAQPDVMDFLMLHTSAYDRRIVSTLHPGAKAVHRNHHIALPSIDPLSLRNRDLPESPVHVLLKQHGIDPERPFVVLILSGKQISSIPSNVIDGFLLAKEEVPELQLLATVSGEMDDQRALSHALHLHHKIGNRDARLLSMNSGIGNTEINALRQAAEAVVEVSHSTETTTDLLEVMWKARPLIVGEKSAVRLGIKDDWNGCVAHSPKDYCRKIVHLVRFPQVAMSIGETAREYVRDKFLITTLLSTYLTLLRGLVDEGQCLAVDGI